MKCHEDLYAGKSIRRRLWKVKWKIVHNAGQIRVYVITFSSNEKNLLDIIPSRELLQKHYPKKDLYVIGLAGNYKEAVELAAYIVSEVYQATGGFDVRSYIRQKGKLNT